MAASKVRGDGRTDLVAGPSGIALHLRAAPPLAGFATRPSPTDRSAKTDHELTSTQEHPMGPASIGQNRGLHFGPNKENPCELCAAMSTD